MSTALLDNGSFDRLIVTGIGTGVGKTVVSAILARALEADYWKPVQAGDLDNSDSMKVAALTESKVIVHKEAFRLSEPLSPHAAAMIDGISIDIDSITLPSTERRLVIEGAGGVMVPLNNKGTLYIDVFEQWNFPVVVVSRHYLGSINHTLLTIEALQRRNITVAGIIFVGAENHATESIIATRTGISILGRVPLTDDINADFVRQEAGKFAKSAV